MKDERECGWKGQAPDSTNWNVSMKYEMNLGEWLRSPQLKTASCDIIMSRSCVRL